MSSDLILRPIESRDNVSLAALIRRVFDEYDIPKTGTVYSDPWTDTLFEVFQEPGSAYWIAEHNGHLAGGCGYFPTPGLPAGYAELVKLYLDPSARGKGTGRRLMEHTLNAARDAGYTHLYLESFPAFTEALAMYSAMGFEQIGHPLGNSGHYACNIWMVKKL